jgi:iron complex transport system permease protein
MAPWVTWRSARFPISFRLDRRVPIMAFWVLLITFTAMVLNMSVGEYQISPLDVLRTLFGIETGDAQHHFVVINLRLPRMLLAWLVGAALSIAGNIVQGITRNPLASPDLTGVTAGAGLAAAVLIVMFPMAPTGLLPFAALAGGVAVALMLYFLAWRHGDSPMRMILVGIGLEAALASITSFVLTFGKIDLVQQAMLWLSGTVYAATWGEVRSMLPWLGIGIPLAIISARHLNALNLGEEVASGLGTRVTFQRAALLLIAVGLAAVTVTVAGTIGFVGLIGPHLARRLVGPMHEGSQLLAALLGGMVLVVSDLVGRTIIAPAEIPVGIIAAIIGAPFFIYLIWQNRERL